MVRLNAHVARVAFWICPLLLFWIS